MGFLVGKDVEDEEMSFRGYLERAVSVGERFGLRVKKRMRDVSFLKL